MPVRVILKCIRGGCIKEKGIQGDPVQSTYLSFSVWVITPKIGRAKNTSSHTISNFSAGPSRGHTHTHTKRMHMHTHAGTYMLSHGHTNTLVKRAVFSAFCLLFAPASSRSPFLFPLASSVSISCDIPFCFLITALFFVLLGPNNFIDGGHKPIHCLSRTACGHKHKFMVEDFMCHLLHLSYGSLPHIYDRLQPWKISCIMSSSTHADLLINN